jgi:O-antigen/teichoic acid export membrane protein
MKIDQVMIKNILGNEQVGLYAVAVKLSEAWYFIPGVITASLFPAIINAHKKSAEDFDGKMSKLYFFMFWGSFLFALFVTFLASPIISILFGQEYLGAIVVLQIYVWSAIIISMKRVIGRYLLTKNFTKIMFYSNLIGLIFNLILNIILIKHYGIAGAAVATIVSYSSTLFVLFFINKTRSHAILMLKSILKFK